MPGSTWRAVGALSSVGLSFVLAIVIGVAVGLWVDRRLGTAPSGFFLFFAFGLAAGILNVYRIVSQAYPRQAAGATPAAPSAGMPETGDGPDDRAFAEKMRSKITAKTHFIFILDSFEFSGPL